MVQMKSRYSIGRLNYRTIESLAKRRLGKSPDEGKLRIGDIIICAAVFILPNYGILPKDIPQRMEIQTCLAVAIMFVGIFLNLYRMAPRPCWTKATWSVGAIATVFSTLPWILYLAGEAELSLARNLSLCSIAAWVVFIGCFLRLRYIRRRSQRDIAMIRLREKRRRAQQYR